MCKCCNLFSPNQSELLSHVSEKHAEEGVNVDEIIIPLRPLSTPEPTNPSKSGDGKRPGVPGEGATATDVPVDDDGVDLLTCALLRFLFGRHRNPEHSHFPQLIIVQL